MRIPKARDWLQADKEHPLLIQRREEKNALTANQQKLQHKEYVHIRLDKSEDVTEKKREEKLKLDLNHPALQPINLKAKAKEDFAIEEVELAPKAYKFFEEQETEDHKTEDAIEKYELANVFKEWLSGAQNDQKLPWTETDAEDSFFVWSRSDRVDPFHGFDWSKSQTGRLFKVHGGRDGRGRIHGKAEILFQNGEEVCGTFFHGRRQGRCIIKSLPKGITCLSGSWIADKLQGFTRCKFTDGSVSEGWVQDGVWHGVYR